MDDEKTHKIYDLDESKNGSKTGYNGGSDFESAQSPHVIGVSHGDIDETHGSKHKLSDARVLSLGKSKGPGKNGVSGRRNKNKRNNDHINIIKVESVENPIRWSSWGHVNNLSCARLDEYNIMDSPTRYALIIDKESTKRSVINFGTIHGIMPETKATSVNKFVSRPIVSCKLTTVDKINSWGQFIKIFCQMERYQLYKLD